MSRILPRPSHFALILGLVFVAASLTPSLVPREPFLQGVLGGVVMALGYLTGRIIELIWNFADMPVAKGDARDVTLGILALAALGLVGWSLAYSLTWQNDLRGRMGLEPAEQGHLVWVVVLTLVVFAVLFLIGHVIALISRLIRGWLERIMPPRRADVLGFLLVALGLFVVTRDGILDWFIGVMDTTFETAQNLFDTAPPPPDGLRNSGGQGSLVDWQAMGQPGRDFVTSGPDAAAIAAFTGRPALDPIRVYVGRANGETPQERAELALEELKRLGAFDRKLLVVTSPTGTGWMDPGSHDPLEYMHGGDIATVSTQYSYLQSPFALVFETTTGLEQATATLAVIHDYWKTLPEETRPRLYVHGLSLGAWSSMYATNLFRLVDDPIDGAFWPDHRSRQISGTGFSRPGTKARPLCIRPSAMAASSAMPRGPTMAARARRPGATCGSCSCNTPATPSCSLIRCHCSAAPSGCANRRVMACPPICGSCPSSRNSSLRSTWRCRPRLRQVTGIPTTPRTISRPGCR